MNEESGATYGAIYCEDCRKTHYYKSARGAAQVEHESITCPSCDRELAEKRAACGYHFLGSRDGDQGEWTCDLDDQTIEDIENLLGAVGRPGL